MSQKKAHPTLPENPIISDETNQKIIDLEDQMSQFLASQAFFVRSVTELCQAELEEDQPLLLGMLLTGQRLQQEGDDMLLQLAALRVRDHVDCE